MTSFLFSPFLVKADNCCSTFKTSYGVVSKSCIAGPEIKKENCNDISNTFVENASCNSTGESCVAATSTADSQKSSSRDPLKPLKFTFNVPLPGLVSTFNVSNDSLPDYVSWLYKFVLGVCCLLAVFMITLGGLMWIFSGGDAGNIKKAKDYIAGAIMGLLLALSSYSILYIINPQLIRNQMPTIGTVDKATLDENYNDPGPSSNEYWKYDKNTKTVKDMYCYKQGWKNWGGIDYGNCGDGSTIGKAGCGPSSLAMIVSTLKKQSITPDVVAKKVIARGGRTCGSGSSPAGLKSVAINDYQLKASEVSWDNLGSCLSKGGYIIGSTHGPKSRNYPKPAECGVFTQNGHFVVIGSINGNKIEINDPANGKITGSQSCFRSEDSSLVRKCTDIFLCISN